MIEVRKKDYVDSSLAHEILNRHTQDGVGLIIDIERTAQHQADYRKRIRESLREYREIAKSNTLMPTSPLQVKMHLIDYFRIPEKLVPKTDSSTLESLLQMQRISLDDSLEKDAKRFIELQIDLKRCYSGYGHLEAFIAHAIPCNELSFEGHRVTIARPTWSVKNTGRFSTSQPNFQGIAKEHLDIVTYFPWMRLCGADSGQIEPRITYSAFIKDPLIKHLITIYNDAYFGIMHYVRMSKAEKIAAYKDMTTVKKLQVTDEIQAARNSIKKLMLSTGYGGDSIARGMELGPAFIRDIQQHPLRKKLIEEISKKAAQGQETFYSYFGTPVTPKETSKYQKNTYGWQNHIERCGFNNPIQATAADLMNISVYNANKIIRERAKSTWTSIAGYIHDAGYFYVSNKDADLADDLMECMSYQVYDEDGTPWIPIYCDKHIGLRGI